MVRAAPPWVQRRWRRQWAPSRGCHPPRAVSGGEKGLVPPRPIAVASNLLSPPGQQGGPARGASSASGR